MNKLTLRPHHMLCTRLFTGHGYSSSFAERMGEVVSRLGLTKYQPPVDYPLSSGVEFVIGTDTICQNCPNRSEEQNNICMLGNENVILKDRKTLTYAGMSTGKTYTIQEVSQGIAHITKEQFEEICGTCRWYRAGYCRYEDL
jgi:hypothetical protein